ncbi:DUF3768 domain-containing protein [uncultured Roseobacter sp.]|uniref:DUF3768 domain-containing protein n=1 Tax=uncultured Roseobacter sp. TaxID=114847 RepID=UPI0026089E1E|nr:DUF3768 domain-containing protein [uncultured Roseobacter sp.]
MHITAETIGTAPRCRNCGSERVVRDAWACFNPESGLWELEAIRDGQHCHQCDASTKLEWSSVDHPPHLRIRELNDRFRTNGEGRGTVFVTSGLQAEGGGFVAKAVGAVRHFSDFSDDNDPWGEHDFGAIDLDGRKVFFKLNYYTDETLSAGSANPANEGMTYRVMTIMLSSEY